MFQRWQTGDVLFRRMDSSSWAVAVKGIAEKMNPIQQWARRLYLRSSERE